MNLWEAGGVLLALIIIGASVATIATGGLRARPPARPEPVHRAEFEVLDPATGRIYQPGDELPLDTTLIVGTGARFTIRTRPDAPTRPFDFDQEA